MTDRDRVAFETHTPEGALTVRYPATVTPLKSGGRRDVIVTADQLPELAGTTDFVRSLRQFIAGIDRYAADVDGDPVAILHALTRVEAIEADWRAVRDSLRDRLAGTLKDEQIRKLAVEGVGLVEASSTGDRSDWQHDALMVRVLKDMTGDTWVIAGSGEAVHVRDIAARLLVFFRPAWRLTPLRDAGIDPDDYSTVERDEDGRPVRTPTVRILENRLR